MTVTAKCFREAKYAETTDTAQYTAPASTSAIVDKFSVTNTSASAATLIVNLVAFGSTVFAANKVAAVTVAAGDTLSLPALSGQVLNPGDFISTLAGTASTLVIRISGREVT